MPILLKNILIPLFITVLILSCGTDPENESTQELMTYKQDSLESGTKYNIDSTTSIATWIGTRSDGKHNGIFKIKEGYFVVIDSGEGEGTSNDLQVDKIIKEARIVIDMTTVDVLDLKHAPQEYDQLLRYLKSPQFFNTDTYPESVIEIMGVEKLPEDSLRNQDINITSIDPTHEATARLTIKDTTKELKFPVRIDIRNLKLEVSAKVDLRESGWNIDISHNRNSADPKLIDNLSTLGFEIIAFTENP